MQAKVLHGGCRPALLHNRRRGYQAFSQSGHLTIGITMGGARPMPFAVTR